MVNIIGPWFKFLNLNHTSTIATQYPQSQPPSSPKKLLMNTTSNSSSYFSTSLMCVTKVTRSNDNFIRQLSLIVVAISCFTLLLSVANFIKSLVASRKINKPNHSSSSTMNALSPDWSSSKTLSVYTTAAAVGVTTSPSLTPTRLQFRIEILAPVIWFITCTVCLVNAGMEVSVVSNLHSATKCVEMMTMTSADDSNSSSTSSTPASSLFLNPHPSRAIVWLGLECYAMLMVMVRFDWIRRQNALFVQRQQQLQLNPINDDKKLSIMNHLSSTQTKTSLFFQWGLTVCIFALFNFGIALEVQIPSSIIIISLIVKIMNLDNY